MVSGSLLGESGRPSGLNLVAFPTNPRGEIVADPGVPLAVKRGLAPAR
jgi:hypothetical protein